MCECRLNVDTQRYKCKRRRNHEACLPWLIHLFCTLLSVGGLKPRTAHAQPPLPSPYFFSSALLSLLPVLPPNILIISGGTVFSFGVFFQPFSKCFIQSCAQGRP